MAKDGFQFTLRCLHPEPPTPNEAATSGPRDRELIKVAQVIRDNPHPHIVLGDLKDVAWSDTSYAFEKISRLKEVHNKYIEIRHKFRDFILKGNHPCVMAQTVFKMEHVDMKVYGTMDSLQTAQSLMGDIERFLEKHVPDDNDFNTFMAV
jgi:hypothetical protein